MPSSAHPPGWQVTIRVPAEVPDDRLDRPILRRYLGPLVPPIAAFRAAGGPPMNRPNGQNPQAVEP